MKLISKVAAGGTLLASAGVACAGALVIAALERRKRRSGALDGKVQEVGRDFTRAHALTPLAARAGIGSGTTRAVPHQAGRAAGRRTR